MRLGRAFGRAAIAIAALALAASVHAQSLYPSKPIRMVVGFPPGGEMDLSARLYSTKLQEALNTPIVVENRPGGTGLLAGEHVAKSAPDGYTLLVGASGQMTINPVLMARHPYDPVRDFAAITTLAQFPMVIAVNPSFPGDRSPSSSPSPSPGRASSTTATAAPRTRSQPRCSIRRWASRCATSPTRAARRR